MAKRKRQQGELEAAVLGALWDSPVPLTSNEILLALGNKASLALTTVLTVLSRLEEKGFVTRESGVGRSHIYEATTTREQHVANQLLELIQGDSDANLTLSYFTAGLDKKTLSALKKLLSEK